MQKRQLCLKMLEHVHVHCHLFRFVGSSLQRDFQRKRVADSTNLCFVRDPSPNSQLAIVVRGVAPPTKFSQIAFCTGRPAKIGEGSTNKQCKQCSTPARTPEAHRDVQRFEQLRDSDCFLTLWRPQPPNAWRCSTSAPSAAPRNRRWCGSGLVPLACACTEPWPRSSGRRCVLRTLSQKNVWDPKHSQILDFSGTGCTNNKKLMK